MPTYVCLVNFTDQGIRNVKETLQRLEQGKTNAERLGFRLVQFYYTMGQHDGIGIFEAKDEESASAAVLALGAAGNVRTLTMRAYTPDEMKSILSKF